MWATLNELDFHLDPNANSSELWLNEITLIEVVIFVNWCIGFDIELVETYKFTIPV